MYRNKDRVLVKSSMVGGRIVYQHKMVRGGMVYDIDPKRKDVMNRFHPLPYERNRFIGMRDQAKKPDRSAEEITKSLGGMLLGKSGKRRVGRGITLI